jgi:4-hydroxybenzoate polyprenyltransferase
MCADAVSLWCDVSVGVQLKQSGWIGNYALGCSYISLPWWCGQAMFGTLSLPVVVLTVLYRYNLHIRLRRL